MNTFHKSHKELSTDDKVNKIAAWAKTIEKRLSVLEGKNTQAPIATKADDLSTNDTEETEELF